MGPLALPRPIATSVISPSKSKNLARTRRTSGAASVASSVTASKGSESARRGDEPGGRDGKVDVGAGEGDAGSGEAPAERSPDAAVPAAGSSGDRDGGKSEELVPERKQPVVVPRAKLDPEDCMRVHTGEVTSVLLDDARGDTGGAPFNLLHSVLPPGAGCPWHTHERVGDTEVFYVLRGVVEFGAGDECVLLRAGGTISVPCRTPRCFVNSGAEPAEILIMNVAGPGGWGGKGGNAAGFARAMGQMDPDQRPDPVPMTRMHTLFGVEYVDPPAGNSCGWTFRAGNRPPSPKGVDGDGTTVKCDNCGSSVAVPHVHGKGTGKGKGGSKGKGDRPLAAAVMGPSTQPSGDGGDTSPTATIGTGAGDAGVDDAAKASGGESEGSGGAEAEGADGSEGDGGDNDDGEEGTDEGDDDGESKDA